MPPALTASGEGITTVTTWLPSLPKPSVMLLLSSSNVTISTDLVVFQTSEFMIVGTFSAKNWSSAGTLYWWRGSIWSAAEGVKGTEVGKRWVVEDGAGRPRAVLQTIELTQRRFDEVDAAFAHEEGEGDRTLASWRAAHTDYFTRNGGFAPDMPLIHSDGSSVIVRGPVARQWAKIAQGARATIRVAYVRPKASGGLEVYDTHAFGARRSTARSCATGRTT